MITVDKVTVIARRWSGGWELIIDDDNATAVRTLARATEQVRDYLDTVEPGVDHAEVDVDIVADIGPVSGQIAHARKQTAAAAQAQLDAANRSRRVARALHDAGLSLADGAVLLGVSKGRMAQLVSRPSPDVKR